MISTDTALRSLSVKGRITKWNYWEPQDAYYFALEDLNEKSVIEGVIFGQSEKQLPDDIGMGMTVDVEGYIELYRKGGYHRLRAAGITADDSETAETFEELYDRLEKAGYFRQKRDIPEMPEKICVITSDKGDVIHDFLTNIERRCPIVNIIFIPAAVSGEGAVQSLISAFKTANETDAELILFGRGGGDKKEIDDVFNSVELAKAIVESRIPTISAVGHEPNHTIADYAADKRVSTPTAAAEAAVPDMRDKLRELDNKRKHIAVMLGGVFESKRTAVMLMNERIKAASPLQRLNADEQKLDSAAGRLKMLMERITDRKLYICTDQYRRISSRVGSLTESKERAFLHTAAVIEALDPMKVLLRGYSITYKDGKALTGTAGVMQGDRLSIKLADGTVNAVVENTEKDK